MEIIPEAHNIVIVGGWNRKIFSPGWIKENLAELDEISLEIAITDPSEPFRLAFSDILLKVGGDRLQMSSKDPSDENLLRLQEMAEKIIRLLPHTPMRAIGINFHWIETEPNQDLLAAFNLPDAGALADAGAVTSETQVKRTLEFDGLLLNLGLFLTPEGPVRLEVNFHQPADTVEKVIAHLNRGVVELREKAKEILADTYTLEG